MTWMKQTYNDLSSIQTLYLSKTSNKTFWKLNVKIDDAIIFYKHQLFGAIPHSSKTARILHIFSIFLIFLDTLVLLLPVVFNISTLFFLPKSCVYFLGNGPHTFYSDKPIGKYWPPKQSYTSQSLHNIFKASITGEKIQ